MKNKMVSPNEIFMCDMIESIYSHESLSAKDIGILMFLSTAVKIGNTHPSQNDIANVFNISPNSAASSMNLLQDLRIINMYKDENDDLKYEFLFERNIKPSINIVNLFENFN